MKRRLTVLLVCLFLVMLTPITNASVLAAQGQTIIVTSTSDSGPGTLRQALQDAQSGDTITFDPAVFPPDAPATIYLTSELPPLLQGNLKLDASNAGVILDGSNIPSSPEHQIAGLEIQSSGNIIQGLQIVNYSYACGIHLAPGSQNNTIGGDRSAGSGPLGQGNLVSKVSVGIGLGEASFNTVKGNLIGTDPAGTGDWGNSQLGVYIGYGSHNTVGPDNIIAYNSVGVEITGSNSLGNTITRNSIHHNHEKVSIDLREGGNAGLPAPTILGYDLADGTVTGYANVGCIIEIFSDSSNEGEIYEGQTVIDGPGFFTFSKGASLAGPNLTATATAADGSTSTFSAATSGNRRDAGDFPAPTLGTYADWIVTGDEVWQDETIALYGKVIVEGGASLTLRNVTLTFDNPTDTECGVIAGPGSSLAIYDSTLSRPSHLELGGFYIHVENASFVMKDSILDGVSRKYPPGYREWGVEEATAGLTLDNVKGAVIENNEIKHIQFLVAVWHNVSDSIFTNNVITPLRQVTHSYPGFLYLWDSDNNTITDNHITGVSHAITMYDRSTGNYIAGNEFTTFRAGHMYMGMTLTEDSNNNIFTDNIIIGPSGCTPFRIFTRNNVITNNTISDFRYGVVLAAGADGNIIAGNNFSHIFDEDAIFVFKASGNYIINNNISSSIRGISITYSSRNNVIQANTVSGCQQGILISSSSNDNLIANNKVSGNKVGITVFKSSGNEIYDNSFIGNSRQGYDDGENIWSLENRGNYWSDYRGEGDTTYDITPAGIDRYPLAESVSVVPVQVPEPAPLTFKEILSPPGQAITEEVRLEDTEILMENSYWIPEGGTLILENVTLRSYKEAASPYEIKVEGGTLIISNSRIIATETGIAPITISAKRGSTLVIKDSELHHVGDVPSGGAVTIYCEGAILEDNLISDSFIGIWLEEEGGASSARIVNNTFEGCFEAIQGGDIPWVKEVIEGNTIIDPVPAELVRGFWAMIFTVGRRILVYWLKDPRVIAGLSVIVIGVIALVWFLIRRRRRRKAKAAVTG